MSDEILDAIDNDPELRTLVDEVESEYDTLVCGVTDDDTDDEDDYNDDEDFDDEDEDVFLRVSQNRSRGRWDDDDFN